MAIKKWNEKKMHAVAEDKAHKNMGESGGRAYKNAS